MNILMIGSGAREHAIAKVLSRSVSQPKIYCCGQSNNPGLMQLCKESVVTDFLNVQTILKYAKSWKIDFAVIGPEAPLEIGLVDALQQIKIPSIGPSKSLARIETSKAFTRALLTKYQIPGSLRYERCLDLTDARRILEELGEGNYVIKADGLMGGKGVKVAGDHLLNFNDAYQFCEELQQKQSAYVIEEKCIGEEFSLMCFSDGKTLVPMPVVQDHKRAYAYDKGPNTGGMGSYSDANHLLPFLTPADFKSAMNINQQVIEALATETGQRYVGILYGSFMATEDGVRLIEYNARFGDPEALNVLSIIESDLVLIFQSMLDGTLKKDQARFQTLATVCKYAVPEGYPDRPIKNELIDFSNVKNKEHLYFGSVNQAGEHVYALGSRACAVVGVAPTLFEAEKIAEEEIQNIKGRLFHRADIGTEELIQRRVKRMRALRQCYA